MVMNHPVHSNDIDRYQLEKCERKQRITFNLLIGGARLHICGGPTKKVEREFEENCLTSLTTREVRSINTETQRFLR